MKSKLHWLRYLSPVAGIIFCPVTILFIWAICTGPIESEVKAPLIQMKD